MKKDTKAELLSYFYKYFIKIVPIVNDKNNNKIIGVLTKDDLVSSTSFASQLNRDAKSIIEEHIIPVDLEKDIKILQNLIENFKLTKTIPVLNIEGKITDTWSKEELFLAWLGCYNTFPFLLGLDYIFSQFVYPIVIIDEKDKVIYLNQKAEEVFGSIKKNKYLIDSLVIKEKKKEPYLKNKIALGEKEVFYDIFPILKEDILKGYIYIFYIYDEANRSNRE